MPKLITNVLIGGAVRLAGEDISEADARGVRPEVFAPDASAPREPSDEQGEPAKPQRRRNAKAPRSE